MKAQQLENKVSRGRKTMKELKERVTEELLPRRFFAVRRVTQVWIDPVHHFGKVVDAANPNRC